MNIYILHSPSIEAIPSYTATDCFHALKDHFSSITEIDLPALSKLSRKACDCLILPYKTGNIPATTITHIMTLHEQGMSILILGDVPHHDCWYPIRNNYAFEMHLTRYQDAVRLRQLSPVGKEILGDIDFSSFHDRDITALRITGFPEDVTHNLLEADMGDWRLPCLVAIERKGERFAGSRLAQVGFSGGEPREVAAGVYPMEWTYDIGPLTREWETMDVIVRRLVQWCEPHVDASIHITPVHKENESCAREVRIHNPSQHPQEIAQLRLELIAGDKTEVLQSWEKQKLEVGEHKVLALVLNTEHQAVLKRPGLHSLRLVGIRNGKNHEFHQTTEHIVAASASSNPVGFGFSSHRGYKEATQSKEDKHFIKELMKRGCQYGRMNVPWEEIEPSPGEYNWGLTDDMVAFADEQNITIAFWLFPTTRGSGLGDVGIPAWTLKEPAIDRDGNAGNYPSLWSPFYREHYFTMLKEMAKRYANAKSLDRIIVDFGNSDFPYGYYYYVNDKTLFDYSPHERKAFARYLTDKKQLSFEQISNLYGENILSEVDIPVPYVEQNEPWALYLEFRTWTLQDGIDQAQKIIKQYAPAKTPPDPPGHGLGSLSDLGTNWYDIKRRHWNEEQALSAHNPELTRWHCAAPFWGGEAWQVGGGYQEFDEALFSAIRFNASYNTVPGPDLNVMGEDIARIGYIRRSITDAERPHPEIAVMGLGAWDDFHSLPNLAARADIGIDYIHRSHRFDFSCYKLFALPSETSPVNRTSTGGGGSLLLPIDQAYGELLLASVEKGTNLLLFPKTCPINVPSSLGLPLRQVAGLEDIIYGPSIERTISFPNEFGGGQLHGKCHSIQATAKDEVLLSDTNGEAVLIRRSHGTGSFLLAGWDDAENLIDDFHYFETAYASEHSLLRIARYLGLKERNIRTGNAVILKDKLSRGKEEFFVAFSHLEQTEEVSVEIRLDQPSSSALDMATGETFPLNVLENGWYKFHIQISPRKGRYLRFS